VDAPRELLGASVELGAVDLQVPAPVLDGPLPGADGTIVADRSHAVVRVAGVGTFGISEGAHVRFDPEPGVPSGAVGIWLHGTVAALLLAQRSRFALHAGVVEVDGRAVALTGPRTAGKSTTALRLTQRGHALVSDDVTPLEPGPPVTVNPFPRTVRVAPATAESLGLDLTGAREILPDHPKLALPAPSRRAVPLSAVVLLGEAPVSGVDAVRVRGAAAQRIIWEGTYRVHLLWSLCEAELFTWSSSIAAQVPVYTVHRPQDDWTVDAVADAVERVAVDQAAA
jgi:hypothetical protein